MPLRGMTLLATAYTPEQFPSARAPEVVLVGRSNVGKSSLANRLAGLSIRQLRRQGARVSGKPGCTRSINFYQLWKDLTLVDLPGYGFARLPGRQRREIGQLVEAYLRNRPSIALILHVVDARLPLQKSDWEMLEWSRQFGYFHLLAMNKCDKLSRPSIGSRKADILRELKTAQISAGLIAVSAETGQGVSELAACIHDSVRHMKRGNGNAV